MTVRRTIITRMNKRFEEFFRDIDGTMSLKRLLAFSFSLLFAFIIIVELFWHIMISKAILDVLEIILVSLIAGITSEKFTKRGVTSVETNDEIMKEKVKEDKVITKEEILK